MKIAASSISSSTPLHYEMFANRPAIGLFLSRHKDDLPPSFFSKKKTNGENKRIVVSFLIWYGFAPCQRGFKSFLVFEVRITSDGESLALLVPSVTHEYFCLLVFYCVAKLKN